MKEGTGQSLSSLLHIAYDRSRWATTAAEASVGIPQRRPRECERKTRTPANCENRRNATGSKRKHADDLAAADLRDLPHLFMGEMLPTLSQ